MNGLSTHRAVQVPLWRVMAVADAPLTIDDLHRRSGADRRALRHRLTCWLNAGLVARIDGDQPSFRMTDAADRAAGPPRTDYAGTVRPRHRSDRERLWSAMRVLGSFDAPALKMSAGATDRSVATFLNALQRAGYVRMTKRGSAKVGRWASYTLARNTGRHVPKITHTREPDGTARTVLIDRNTGAIVDISPASVRLTSKKSADPVDGGEG